MNRRCSEPVCLRSSVEERFLINYSSKETQEWQNLKQFWNDNESSNLPHCSVKTSRKHSESKVTDISKMVNGNSINDIPTSYSILGFKPHELIVIGTYVDKNIAPGFQYKVRKNFSEEYYFDGNAPTLQSVGLGYGKRLTFQGLSLNKNKNYFWSDSYPHGYGLTFQAITPDFKFRILNAQTNCDIGRVTVNNPARSVDVEVETVAQDKGQLRKTVRVHFSGDVIFHNSCSRQNTFYEDIDIHGTAVIVREDLYSKAKIHEIVLNDFVVDNCLLVPEE